MVPRKQAGHMTCTRPQAERQNLLAMRASSTHDPKPTSTVRCEIQPVPLTTAIGGAILFLHSYTIVDEA
jgi:hypothetical protein